MNRRRLVVVHRSDQVRESVAILLEDLGSILISTVDSFLADPSSCHDADLLIAPGDLPLRALEGLARVPPILWLLEPGGNGPSFKAARSTTLEVPFRPADLHGAVDLLLSSTTSPHPPAELVGTVEFPFLSRSTALRLSKLVGLELPVLICGEPGTGKRRVVRFLSLTQPQRRLYRADAPGMVEAIVTNIVSGEDPEAVLLVREVSELSRGDEQILEDLLDHGGFAGPRGWRKIRVITCSQLPFNSLAQEPRIPASLFYRLGGVVIDIEPLRQRTPDIPALATAILERLAGMLRRPALAITPSAVRRLESYLWFGNVAELEAVLTRSILALPDQRTSLEGEDLCFRTHTLPRSLPKAAPIAMSTEPAPSMRVSAGASIDNADGAAHLIIQELAHEFKNPMVAVKTAAQRLELGTIQDQERRELARLAAESIDRMDRSLENLLEFSRFGVPQRSHVPLNGLLAAALSATKAAAKEVGVQLEYAPPPPRLVEVDPEQIRYAVENLLRAVIRDTSQGRTVTVRGSTGACTIAIESPMDGPRISERLSQMLGESTNGHKKDEPLGFVLAQSLVERNAGRVEVTSDTRARIISIYLPGERNTGTP